jgi:Domain of unknown function (DUF4145)
LSVSVVSTINETMRAHCSNCKDERNCETVTKVEERGGDEDFQWHTDWFILKCKGCDYVFVKKVMSNSEDYDNFYKDDGSTGTEYNEVVSYFPPLSKRPHPEWLFQYNRMQNPKGLGIGSVFEQVYGALNNDLPVLAAIGIRTSFDLAAVQLNVDPSKSFEKKIEELIRTGKIKDLDKTMISQLVDAGSASAHRGWVPSEKQLELMIELLESFIEENFIVPERRRLLDIKSKKLLDGIPPRQMPKSSP